MIFRERITQMTLLSEAFKTIMILTFGFFPLWGRNSTIISLSGDPFDPVASMMWIVLEFKKKKKDILLNLKF